MLRTMLVATGVVLVAVVAYFFVLGTDANTVTGRDDSALVVEGAPAAEDGAVADDAPAVVAQNTTNDAVAEENMSNRAASDAATDEAFESALEGEEPVQSNVEESRAAADATGAVGATAFTPEGFDRSTVVVAIEDSNLDEAEKDRLMALLAEIEPADGDLEPALAQIRAALELEY